MKLRNDVKKEFHVENEANDLTAAQKKKAKIADKVAEKKKTRVRKNAQNMKEETKVDE